MEKYIQLPSVDKQGNPLVEAIRFPAPGVALEKTASLKYAQLEPEMRDFVSNLKPVEGKLFVLVNALGAYEYWGPNHNADAFREEVLANSDPANGYRTFLKATVFRHHRNKNPEGEGFGRIVVAVYNPRMHRVELLLEIDRAKASLLGHDDLIERLDAGENPAVSMGMRTSYDVCSWCGNKSYKADGSDKCRHLKPLRMGGDGSKLAVREDGVVCCMFNVRFVGFDLSFVDIGADSTSFSIAKVARRGGETEASKPTWQSKLAEIIKRIPAMSAFAEQDPFLGSDRLQRLAQMGTPRAVAATARAGIVLKPEEFQWLSLRGAGFGDIADSLLHKGMVAGGCPAGVSGASVRIPEEHPGVEAMGCVAPWMPQRSVYEPFLNRPRVAHVQLTIVPFGSDPLLSQVSRAYDGYRHSLACSMPIMAQHASLDPTLASMLCPDWLFTQSTGLNKTAMIGPKGITLMGVLPAAYLLNSLFNKEGESGVVQFVKDHPVIAASFLIGALGATK